MTTKWEDDSVQFPRLIAELQGILCEKDFQDLCTSMDLEPFELEELFNRAVKVWEEKKREQFLQDVGHFIDWYR